MWLMIILLVTKNQGFTLSLEDTFLERPQGLRSKWTSPRSVFLEFKNNIISFLYHRLWWRDSDPSSWQSYTLELPLIALVIASTALCWIDLSFSWKEFQSIWSYKISPLPRCGIIKILQIAIKCYKFYKIL